MSGARETPTRSVKHEWMDAVLADRSGRLDGYAVAVAAGLWSRMDRAGLCWPSLRLLIAETKMAQNTVQSRIRMLEDAGFLAVVRRPRGANTYRAILSPSASPHDTDGRPSASPHDATASPHDTDSRRRGSASYPGPSASYPPPSASYPGPSASYPPPSASPGDAEHVNPRRGEHVNPALSVDAPPAGASSLGEPATPSERLEAIQAIDIAHQRLDAYDRAIEEHPVLVADETHEPPDEISTDAMLERRLTGLGIYATNAQNEREIRTELSAEQAAELIAIATAVTGWLVNDDAPPLWMTRTLNRRADFVAALDDRAARTNGARS